VEPPGASAARRPRRGEIFGGTPDGSETLRPTATGIFPVLLCDVPLLFMS